MANSSNTTQQGKGGKTGSDSTSGKPAGGKDQRTGSDKQSSGRGK
jgi:hypothetical protein